MLRLLFASPILSTQLQHDDNQFNFTLKVGVSQWSHDHRPRSSRFIIRNGIPQNADLPRIYTKREKKPFPTPIIEQRRASRERVKRLLKMPRKPAQPPRNGLLVKHLVSVAYDVLNARVTLINNLKKLMMTVPVLACRHCDEIHVGSTGHPFRTCEGIQASARRGLHVWTNANVDDVFVPIEAYHLFDRLGKRITHWERLSIPRIPALIELCIQAGVDLPGLHTKRRRKPATRLGKNVVVDADEDDLPDEFDPYALFRKPILAEIFDSEVTLLVEPKEVALLASQTFEAWEVVREGAQKLMKKYAVCVCGYCPEVHVGKCGHKAQNCGARKHEQRNGQHGWQKAVLDDLIPPRYVWHLPESMPELRRELRNYYGKAPAIVELCMQGGMEVPEKYKPTMRLDVGIPSDLREADMAV